MRKALFLVSILSSLCFYSQNFGAINEILEKIENKYKKMTDASDYTINNKKFVLLEEFSDHSERHIPTFFLVILCEREMQFRSEPTIWKANKSPLLLFTIYI